MINRYDCPEISQIWNEQNKFETYLKVELALVRALEGIKVPKGTAKTISESAKVDPERIKEIEATTKHDVIAFCTSITENLPEQISKFFHFGCTSSDIIDTATNLQIKDSLALILTQYEALLKALAKRAKETKELPCMGRSHGMNAEPMSFGQKFLGHYAELYRHYLDLKNFYENEITGQFSGAVGNYTLLNTDIEQKAVQDLGLEVEALSSQVIPRDRIAKLVSINALIASAIERLAVEIRHLHHSDIGEVNEGFSKGQKGSSIMPHKKNPVSTENLSGIARVIRSHLLIAHENIPLWHERDISHSSAERMMLPDNLGLVHYALKRMSSTVENLVVHNEKIKNKVLSNFTYLSSYILHLIIEKLDLAREEIYPIVQQAAFESSDASQFIDKVSSNPKLKDLDLSSIKGFNENTIRSLYLGETDNVFERVFKSYPLI
ncbi:MAG: adenylosuccinate lyase [Bacteriovoracaceae bacterium]|nr:adenylosuccinate lyase [Bacteriovoracaceae bacterium]